MSQPVYLFASLLVAIIGGIIGALLVHWVKYGIGAAPRRRPIGQYECPHGFATVRECPTCTHFAKIRMSEQTAQGPGTGTYIAEREPQRTGESGPGMPFPW